VGELTGGVIMDRFRLWVGWEMMGPSLGATGHVGGGFEGEVGRGA
jgi:hypothetical protein